MLETISEYIDLRIVLLIVIAFACFLILKFLYKKVSMPKVCQIFLTLVVLLGNIYLIYSYICTIENEQIEYKQEYYVKGRVEFVSKSTKSIRLEYLDTNMIIQSLTDKELIVKVSSSTRIYDKSGNKITLSDIKKGETVMIRTSTLTLSNGEREIRANKIQKY